MSKYAYCPRGGQDVISLTDKELDLLNDDTDFVYELLMEYLF